MTSPDDCMIALPGRLFDSTRIPACLWFLARDKGLRDRRGEILFHDAHKPGVTVSRILLLMSMRSRWPLADVCKETAQGGLPPLGPETTCEKGTNHMSFFSVWKSGAPAYARQEPRQQLPERTSLFTNQFSHRRRRVSTVDTRQAARNEEAALFNSVASARTYHR